MNSNSPSDRGVSRAGLWGHLIPFTIFSCKKALSTIVRYRKGYHLGEPWPLVPATNGFSPSFIYGCCKCLLTLQLGGAYLKGVIVCKGIKYFSSKRWGYE